MLDIMPTLVQNVVVLVLLIFPGFLFAKGGLSTPGLGKGIANIILYAAQPALIIHGFANTNFGTEIIKNMGMVLLFSVFAHLFFFLVGSLVFKRAPDGKRQVLQFATVFVNAGYLGIPLLAETFGDEVIIYASVYVAVFNALVWALGAYIYTADKSYMSVKKMILNPATISTIIGMGIFLLSMIPQVRDVFIEPVIRTEGIVHSLMLLLKGLVAPLSMFMVGLRLAEVNFKTALLDKWLYIYIGVCMILCPATIYLVLHLCRFFHADEITMTVILILTSAPAATATSMFAERLEGDTRYSGVLVSISSLLCVVTIPLVSLLMQFYN